MAFNVLFLTAFKAVAGLTQRIRAAFPVVTSLSTLFLLTLELSFQISDKTFEDINLFIPSFNFPGMG